MLCLSPNLKSWRLKFVAKVSKWESSGLQVKLEVSEASIYHGSCGACGVNLIGKLMMYLYKHCNCKIFTINYKSTTCRTASLGAVTRPESKSQACTVQYTSNWSQSLFLILFCGRSKSRSLDQANIHYLHSLISVKQRGKLHFAHKRSHGCKTTTKSYSHFVFVTCTWPVSSQHSLLHDYQHSTIFKSNFQHVFKVKYCVYRCCQMKIWDANRIKSHWANFTELTNNLAYYYILFPIYNIK